MRKTINLDEMMAAAFGIPIEESTRRRATGSVPVDLMLKAGASLSTLKALERKGFITITDGQIRLVNIEANLHNA